MATPTSPKGPSTGQPEIRELEQTEQELLKAIAHVRAIAKKHLTVAIHHMKLDGGATRLASDVLSVLPKIEETDTKTEQDMKMDAARYATYLAQRASGLTRRI